MWFLNIAMNVIFFFSNCLLQIYDGNKKPEVLVDGWNVYFFDDLKSLVSIFILFYNDLI